MIYLETCSISIHNDKSIKLINSAYLVHERIIYDEQFYIGNTSFVLRSLSYRTFCISNRRLLNYCFDWTYISRTFYIDHANQNSKMNTENTSIKHFS
jgi:hypothetical protein